MKRYNVLDERESTNGEWVKYDDHKREINHYDKTDEIQEKLISKLKDKIQEMIDNMYSVMVQCESNSTEKKILTESILSHEVFLQTIDFNT